MIVPNLMVTDMRRSVAFYRDVLGMNLTMAVSPTREVMAKSDGEGAVFATLEWDGNQLMLQTVESLAADVPSFTPDQRPVAGGTVYFRGFHPDTVATRASPEQVVKGPEVAWYGMKELYLRDPDGHIICLGAPEGAPPA